MLGKLFPELQAKIFAYCDLSTRVSLRLTCSCFDQLLVNKKRSDRFLAEQALLDGNYELFLFAQEWRQPLLSEYYLSAIESNLPQAVSYLLAKDVIPFPNILDECVKHDKEELFHLLLRECKLKPIDITYLNMLPNRPWLPVELKRELNIENLRRRIGAVLRSGNLELIDLYFQNQMQKFLMRELRMFRQKVLHNVKSYICAKLNSALLEWQDVAYFDNVTLFEQWVGAIGLENAKVQFVSKIGFFREALLMHACQVFYKQKITLGDRLLGAMQVCASSIPLSEGANIAEQAIATCDYERITYIQVNHPNWLTDISSSIYFCAKKRNINTECLNLIYSLKQELFAKDNLNDYCEKLFSRRGNFFLSWLDSKGLTYDLQPIASTFISCGKFKGCLRLKEKGYLFRTEDLFLHLREEVCLADLLYNFLDEQERVKISNQGLDKVCEKGLRWLVDQDLVSREQVENAVTNKSILEWLYN